jgi:ParB/RepB/Spo0J family partition protein
MQLIDVKQIHPNPMQPRNKKADVADLLESMGKVGLVQPIVIVKNGDGYAIIAGHRRFSAAVALGWDKIECDIIDPGDEKLDIARIMTTEVHQGLTGKERALGYQTMIDLGWADEDIIAVSGSNSNDLAAARTLATAKKKLVEKMPPQATLEEMAALVEFDGNSYAIADLTQYIGTDNFVHRLSYQRQERDRRAKVQEATEYLKRTEIRQVPQEYSWKNGVLQLDDWRLKLTPKKHAKCPGHCAYVDHQSDIHYFCDQPMAHGIEISGGVGPKTDEVKALDRLKRQMRALYRASAPVRREFIIGQLKVKPLDPGLLDWAYAWATQHGVPAFNAYNTKTKDYTTSKDVRIRFVAICVSEAENTMEQWVTVQGCVDIKSLNLWLVSYLKVLGKMGYPLSDHEKAAIAGTEYVPVEAKDA